MKGQIKMMETVGVLIFFFVLVFFGFIFYTQFQKGSLEIKQAELQAERSTDVALLVMQLPEVSCSERNVAQKDCVDLAKLPVAEQLMRENAVYYFDQFGFAQIRVDQIFPEEASWMLYNNSGSFRRKISTPIPVLIKNPVTDSFAYGVMTVDTFS